MSETYPKIRAALRDAKLPKAEDRIFYAVTQLQIGQATGAIPNARYEEVKGLLNSYLKSVWDAISKPIYGLDCAPDARWDLFEAPTLQNQRRQEAAIETLQGVAEFKADPLKGALETMIAVRAEMLAIRTLHKDMKALAVKRGAAPAPAEPAKPTPAPAATLAANARVHQFLTKLIATSRTDSIANTTDALTRRVESIEAEWSRREMNGRWKSPHLLQLGAEKGFTGSETFELFTTGGARHANFATNIEKIATGIVDRMCDAFVVKNMAKLAPVLDQMPELENVRLLGSFIPSQASGRIRMDFEGGAGFTLQTQVVYATSSAGNNFIRVPSTFHDVRVPGGEIMKKPSYEKVLETFKKPEPEDEMSPAF